VKNYSFHFEIKDLITQFVNAFDNIVIKRFDKNKVSKNSVQVRYVYSPKQRVMYDLVNKAQNLTVPVVAVSIASVARDENRVFNKIGGFYYAQSTQDISQTNKSNFYKTPVPVNITINMSILTKFQTDMDQIISNFVPYNNPYIIISWKVPEDLAVNANFALPQEIRSEVLWNGNLNLSYPTDINASEKYRIVADTSFTIKGWLFGDPSDTVGNIFYVDNHFYNTSLITAYETLTSYSYSYPLSSGLTDDTEFVGVSGYPQGTNINYTLNV
jgi:hypothetical protein